MKRLLILPSLVVCLSFWACDSTPPADQPVPNAEEDILAQERLGLDRWAAGDPEGYAHSAAEDVTYFDDIGAANRIEDLEEWRGYLASLEIPPHQYELIDPKVQVYGDVGILTLHFHGLGPEGEVLVRWKATSVYRYDAGAWHTVHAHWSLIKEP
jgi:ketosteroid isomerase-like protein